MNAILISLGTAVALGFSSSVHCAAMCGPLVAVGTNSQGTIQKRLVGEYFIGRLSSYSALGAIAGWIAAPLTSGHIGESVRLGLAILVAGLLVYRAIGLVRPAAGQRLLRLGKRPASIGLFEQLARFLPRRGLGLGLATALFPCGALLAGVLAAASSGSSIIGAGMMAVFALSSFPLLITPALAAAKFGPRLQNNTARRFGAVVLLAAAAWVFAPVIRFVMAPAETPACCEHGVQHAAMK
jgi:uncharacterized protein